MKKLLAFITLFALSTTAVAEFKATGGDTPKSTVAQALKIKQDNTPVQLSGKIVRQIDHDEFIFRDATGEIHIDVDDEAWQGLNVVPNETITIFGNVDYETFEANSIEVYRVRK